MLSGKTQKTATQALKRPINPFLIRSWLFLPAVKERFLQKILTLKGSEKPDALIFDLEDSVADTREAKEQARQQLVNYLFVNKEYREKVFSHFVICIRINNIHSPYFKGDIQVVNKIKPDFVAIPKVASSEEVRKYRKNVPQMQLRVTIETIKGYRNREEIMRALLPNEVVSIGYEDLCVDLGIERPMNFKNPTPITHIINSCIISAKGEGIVLVEGPSREYGSRQNLSKLKEECLLSDSIGFDSKGAIHPSQIEIINYTFDRKKLKQKAQEILKKFKMLQDGTFVIEEEENMMDKPTFNFYSKILEEVKK